MVDCFPARGLDDGDCGGGCGGIVVDPEGNGIGGGHGGPISSFCAFEILLFLNGQNDYLFKFSYSQTASEVYAMLITVNDEASGESNDRKHTSITGH